MRFVMKKLIKELQCPLLYEKVELSHRSWCVCVCMYVYIAHFLNISSRMHGRKGKGKTRRTRKENSKKRKK